MLDSLFFGVLGIAILLTVMTAFDRDEIAWPVIAIPTWLICAVTVSNLERRVAFILSDNTVHEHSISYAGGAYMIYFFLMLVIVFVVVFFNRVLEMYRAAAAGKQ